MNLKIKRNIHATGLMRDQLNSRNLSIQNIFKIFSIIDNKKYECKKLRYI